MRSTTMLTLLATLAAACAANPDASDEDGAGDSFLDSGKEDSTWFVEDYSWDSEATLRLVNDADFDLLLDVVGLSHATANAIADAPKPVETLVELDAIPHVGPIAFSKLRSIAIALDYGPALAEEYPPPGEAAAIQETIDTIGAMMIKRYLSGTHMPRNQHAKAHGCVKALFRVQDDLPPELRVGVFEVATEYQAWIRYSNGQSMINPDKDKDVRGMAIKVMGVLGFQLLDGHVADETQDFLLINHPTLMARNVLDYADLTERAASNNQLSVLSYFLSINPADWELRGLFNLLGMVSHKVTSPLDSNYWSTTPYLHGTQAVKLSARPCPGGNPAAMPADPNDDYLREALAARLDHEGACFELMVQVQTDPRAMPIEDPTVEWDEDASPFVTVATLEIPQQDFDTAEGRQTCEDLSFNPWHGIEEHRPLGGINRARLAVYETMTAMRHGHNNRPRTEPTGW